MRAVPFFLLLAACSGRAPSIIDAREDASGAADAGTSPDASPFDAGSPDGGCMPPPPPPEWVPVDTMGPDGEGVLACVSRVGALTDDRVPRDQAYDLTTFGGPGDEQPVACSGQPMADGTWYYAANAQRFACGTRIRLVDSARASCVIVQVADVGPNACVEEAGQRPIWDVSPLASQHLFGVDSAGWSEHRAVIGAPVGSDNALGPCDAQLVSPTSFLRGWIGGPCDSAGDCSYASGECLTGWPGGACSQPCDTSCPDRAGPNAYTACIALDDATRHCVARCDYTLFDTGCRAGYACEERPHPTNGTVRPVCVPASC